MTLYQNIVAIENELTKRYISTIDLQLKMRYEAALNKLKSYRLSLPFSEAGLEIGGRK